MAKFREYEKKAKEFVFDPDFKKKKKAKSPKSGRSDSPRNSRGSSRSGPGKTRFSAKSEVRKMTKGRTKFSDNPKKGRSRGKGPMAKFHSVECAKCHRTCEVPFIPSEGKPVYCDTCFRTTEKGEPTLADINLKLNKIMRALKIKF